MRINYKRDVLTSIKKLQSMISEIGDAMDYTDKGKVEYAELAARRYERMLQEFYYGTRRWKDSIYHYLGYVEQGGVALEIAEVHAVRDRKIFNREIPSRGGHSVFKTIKKLMEMISLLVLAVELANEGQHEEAFNAAQDFQDRVELFFGGRGRRFRDAVLSYVYADYKTAVEETPILSESSRIVLAKARTILNERIQEVLGGDLY